MQSICIIQCFSIFDFTIYQISRSFENCPVIRIVRTGRFYLENISFMHALFQFGCDPRRFRYPNPNVNANISEIKLDEDRNLSLVRDSDEPPNRTRRAAAIASEDLRRELLGNKLL